MRVSLKAVEWTFSQIDTPCQRKICFSSRYLFACRNVALSYFRNRVAQVLALVLPVELVYSRVPERFPFWSACRNVSEKGM